MGSHCTQLDIAKMYNFIEIDISADTHYFVLTLGFFLGAATQVLSSIHRAMCMFDLLQDVGLLNKYTSLNGLQTVLGKVLTVFEVKI